MTSLLGCPVSLAYSRALPQCAFRAASCGTSCCRIGHRLPFNSRRSVCDRSQSRSLTLRQPHTMSHSRTAVHAGNSSAQAQPSGQDLLVVGPGVLGSYVGILWQKQHPSATVVGQTNSTANHDRYCRAIAALTPSFHALNKPIACRLQQMHIQPRTKTDANSRKFPYVLFSAPPSGSPDYPAEVTSPFAGHCPSFVTCNTPCSDSSLYFKFVCAFWLRVGCKGMSGIHLRQALLRVRQLRVSSANQHVREAVKSSCRHHAKFANVRLYSTTTVTSCFRHVTSNNSMSQAVASVKLSL